MSFEATAAVRKLHEHIEVVPREQMILYVLAGYADMNWESWPSQGRIGDETGYSRETVNKILWDLEAKGLVKSNHRKRKDGGQSSKLYKLVLPTVVVTDPGATELSTGLPPHVNTGSHTHVNTGPHPHVNPCSQEPKYERKSLKNNPPPSKYPANVDDEGEDKKSKTNPPLPPQGGAVDNSEKSQALSPLPLQGGAVDNSKKSQEPEAGQPIAPKEPTANVGAKREDKKLESLSPKATSPEKSKSLTPETPTTSTSREVSEDIRSETPEDAICRLSPAAHATFAEVMQARSLPSENPVRAAQAKAVRDHLDEDVTAGRGIEPVTRALQKTLEGIADLRNPMLYFAAELSRQRATANTSLKGREAIRAVSAPPERGLVSEAEWERTLEKLSPALAAMTRKTRKIITEREQEAEAQDRKQVLRKQAELAGRAEHDTTTTHKAVGT